MRAGAPSRRESHHTKISACRWVTSPGLLLEEPMCVATNSGCRNTSLPPEFNSGEQRLPTHSSAASSSVLKLGSRKENEVLRGFWMNTHIALSRKCKETMLFLTMGCSETQRAVFHVSHTHTHIHTRLWVFVRYWITGNDDRSHVINGHNYVIEEWSGFSSK